MPGTICTAAGLPETVVPDAGVTVNHAGPPKDAVPVKEAGEVESVVRVNDWPAGAVPPGAAVKRSPEGYTMLPVPAPGARTLNTTVTDCGELGAPAA